MVLWLKHRPRAQEKYFLFLGWALTSSDMGDLQPLKGEHPGIPVTSSGMWSLTISEKQSLALSIIYEMMFRDYQFGSERKPCRLFYLFLTVHPGHRSRISKMDRKHE